MENEKIPMTLSVSQVAKGHLCSLKSRSTVDVFLSYRSDWIDGGVEVPASSLALFAELDVPFSLSIIRL
jgi:hypothetical protein